jgi:hypothetical protein
MKQKTLSLYLATVYILCACSGSGRASGSLVYTGYGASSYSLESNTEYKKVIKKGKLKAVDLLYTCYVENEKDHKIDCNSYDSPNEKNFIKLALQLKKLGHQVTLRIYVDLKNEKWRAYWRPTDDKKAFLNLSKTIVRFAAIATQIGATALIIGSEYEGLTVPKYLSQWKSIIAETKKKFSGEVLYAANGNPNKNNEPEYLRVPFWYLLDTIGVNYYPPFNGVPTKKNLHAHHRKQLEKYKKFSTTQKKKLAITEIGFPLAESGIKTPYQWLYSKTEKPNSKLRALSMRSFLEEAHKQGVHDIHLWRFLFNEPKIQPLGYVIDEEVLQVMPLLNKK